jgi:hypothetical protein
MRMEGAEAVRGEDQFQGVMTDVDKSKLPPGYFQVDEGGDRYNRGSWRRRRGMVHTDIAKVAAPVTFILGFEMPGTDFALMFVEGTNVRGETNTAQQTYTSPGAGGYGDDYGAEYGYL